MMQLMKKRIFEVDLSKRREEKTPRGQDTDVAREAVRALSRLLEILGLDLDLTGLPPELQGLDLTGLPPEATAHALLEFLTRHPEDEGAQGEGCDVLYKLCACFPELRTALQRDPSVYATVRAAAKVYPDLEECDFYKELCVWLQPPCLVWPGRYR